MANEQKAKQPCALQRQRFAGTRYLIVRAKQLVERLRESRAKRESYRQQSIQSSTQQRARAIERSSIQSRAKRETVFSERVQALERICFEEVRPDILKAIFNAGNSGHPAGSFSIAEQIVVLYNEILRVNPETRSSELRDVFVLGCGHNVPALYSVLGRRGFFDVREFVSGYRNGTVFAGHAKTSVPGIELNTGSLGNALASAVEWASCLLSKRRRDDTTPIVYFLDGNAGFQEGATQEALANAGARKARNLVYIVNDNGFGLDGKTSEDYRKKLEAQGFFVIGKSVQREKNARRIEGLCDDASELDFQKRTDCVIDGNDIASVWKTLAFAKAVVDLGENDKPIAIIFNTVKGFGHEAMAGDNNFHAKVPGMNVETALKGIKKPADYREKNARSRGFEARGLLGGVFERLAERFPSIRIVSADTGSSTGAVGARRVHENDYADVGCREQHLVLGTIGCERAGKPVVAVTFAQYLANRAREQIISLAQHFETSDVNASVVLVGTHQGLSSGRDDMSHHCIDAYSLAAIPGLAVLHAADEIQFWRMMECAIDAKGLFYIGIEKESEIKFRQQHKAVLKDGRIVYVRLEKERKLHGAFDPFYEFEGGTPEVKREGKDAVIVASGLRTYDAIDAAEILEQKGMSVAVIQVTRIDEVGVDELNKSTKGKKTIVVEENVERGSVGERMKASGIQVDKHLCIHGYAGSNSYCELLREQKLGVESIVDAVRSS